MDREGGEESPQVSAGRQLPAERAVGGGQGKSPFSMSVKSRGLEPRGLEPRAVRLGHCPAGWLGGAPPPLSACFLIQVNRTNLLSEADEAMSVRAL